jgi:predicted  nucleic acid-binding Zn-ribbon protein
LSVEKKAAEVFKKYKELKAAKDAEKKPFEEELAVIEKEISRDILDVYKTKRKEKIFPVVGQITGGRCPYCSMDLPIAAKSKLSGGGWIECENHICSRVLFE